MRDSGILRLCALRNIARAGRMPTEKLVIIDTAFCSNVTTGVTRYYAAQGANKEYSRVVMLWNVVTIDPEIKYVIDEDDTQYRIDYESPQYDNDSIELTLVRLEDFYDVAEEA